MTAALAGLLGFAGGCDEEVEDPSWSACLPPASDAAQQPAPSTTDGGPPNNPFDGGADDAAIPVDDAAVPVDAGAPQVPDAAAVNDAAADAAVTGPVTTNKILGKKTLAELRTMCDQRGGYLQMHASCAGANNCKGFSYGDWDAESEISEHTCASANGCKGVSCVYLPADTGKTGEEVYTFEAYAPGNPTSCTTCHAPSTKNPTTNKYEYDLTKFQLWVLPGAARNATNWLELSAYTQEQIVAFGKVSSMPDGTTQVSMREYHHLWSRAEIERVVEYIRTKTPVVREITMPE